MKAFSTMAAIAAAFVLAGPAAAEVWHCKTVVKGADDGFIAPDIIIDHVPGEDTAVVLDGLINNYNGKQPLPAEIVAENAQKVTYAWKLKLHVTGTSATVRYRLTRQKASGAVTISAQALGFANHYTSTGKCAIAK